MGGCLYATPPSTHPCMSIRTALVLNTYVDARVTSGESRNAGTSLPSCALGTGGREADRGAGRQAGRHPRDPPRSALQHGSAARPPTPMPPLGSAPRHGPAAHLPRRHAQTQDVSVDPVPVHAALCLLLMRLGSVAEGLAALRPRNAGSEHALAEAQRLGRGRSFVVVVVVVVVVPGERNVVVSRECWDCWPAGVHMRKSGRL